MRKILLPILLSLLAWRLWPAPKPVLPAGAPLPAATAPAALRFALIKTGDAKTLEGMVVSGGRFTRTVGIGHIAVLVEHPQGRFLFDTGLGAQVAEQFRDEMPVWARPLFAYEHPNPAVAQLKDAGLATPERIFLSHAHWDHASGLVDFADAEVWVPEAERLQAASGQPPAFLPSQLHSPTTKWHPFQFTSGPYAGFDSSLDLFGDGSAVLLPLPGHTPGSTGLLLSLANGQRYFFVGDTVWNHLGVDGPSPKFSIASRIVDGDREAVWQQVLRIRALRDANPGLVIVPAHDSSVHETLGYFPRFVGG